MWRLGRRLATRSAIQTPSGTNKGSICPIPILYQSPRLGVRYAVWYISTNIVILLDTQLRVVDLGNAIVLLA